MVSLLRRVSWPSWASWKPVAFSNSNFPQIPADYLVEEETLPNYLASRYYPVRIGEVLRDRYQIVGKLGFGATSTVWLARDLSGRRHVALKLFVHANSMGSQLDKEINMYKRMKERGSWFHDGRHYVRDLLDSFDIDGPDGRHRCLVHSPLWENMHTFLRRNPIMRLPQPVFAVMLHRLFLALDFLHTECSIIHTDIRADNIMFGIEDDSVFRELEQRELSDPSPRKVLKDRTIYTSRQLSMPKGRGLGAPVLCDFGSAVCGDVEHREDVQPNIYRAPEVILEVPWTSKIDIWNVGCMVWDLFEGGHLFTGHDPELATYRSRAHLAEMTALLGPPPQQFLDQGNLKSKFFSEKGEFSGGIPLPPARSLEELETNNELEDRESFLRMMRMMLQWDPHVRSSAKELADAEWLQGKV
ncbi:serine threonine protein kinase, CMGC group [Xylaria bambusicola]|uniref:serine threonine protein kinase, CMGC group n=1 Tax=Xylaria bambusicola TaxID=326684 RepID=UPI0020084CD8|nr:serine threonine protein kinase, CMGC group [Xylaria bambusicola]KAI0517286.1 serine threonine protein kinase, CMGC group [Xylaria bambusicola]